MIIGSRHVTVQIKDHEIHTVLHTKTLGVYKRSTDQNLLSYKQLPRLSPLVLMH